MQKRQDVYDLYWWFAYERQNIFWKKLNGEPAPWTDDSVLQQFKFCNSYRVNDRVSQYLLKNVIYNGKQYSPEDTLFRILLFKIFNKEATWEMLTERLGDISLENFNFKDYSKICTEEMEAGNALFGDAYFMYPGTRDIFGHYHKFDNYLTLLELMFKKDRIQDKLFECGTMGDAYKLIRKHPMMGDFVTYQYITDFNYSDVVNWREDEFTIAGPGAVRGIAKCFSDTGGMSNEEIIYYMYEHQDEEFERLGYDFKRIGDRPLQLIDCQNIFCETDKYCREAVPDLWVGSGKKIKKKYKANAEKIDYIYPPKWCVVI